MYAFKSIQVRLKMMLAYMYDINNAFGAFNDDFRYLSDTSFDKTFGYVVLSYDVQTFFCCVITRGAASSIRGRNVQWALPAEFRRSILVHYVCKLRRGCKCPLPCSPSLPSPPLLPQYGRTAHARSARAFSGRHL